MIAVVKTDKNVTVMKIAIVQNAKKITAIAKLKNLEFLEKNNAIVQNKLKKPAIPEIIPSGIAIFKEK